MSERLDSIKVWRVEDFPEVELRRGFAVARPVPRHWHEEYQFCLVQAGSGELKYRGESYMTPPAALFAVHPGEVHANRAHGDCSYLDLFVEAELVRSAAADVLGREAGHPFFSTVVISAQDVIRQYVDFHKACEGSSSQLERQGLLLKLLASLIARFSDDCSHRLSRGSERLALRRACDYLLEHYAEDVSLESLAGIACLSPFHFSRVFSAEFGLPPHQFQTLVRVARAKALLREGWPITQAASQAGFFDQSHLNRHFKRVVGVTPGQYCSGSKNVQDSQWAR